MFAVSPNGQVSGATGSAQPNGLIHQMKVVPEEGVEPTRSIAPADFESAASASSATPGCCNETNMGKARTQARMCLTPQAL
jgi:hypothetical protein